MKKILLVGIPGSGKSTQAQRLAKDLNICHISSGDLMRELVKSDSKLSEELKTIVNHGGLVSDDLTARVVKDRVNNDDCQNGFVIEGYPRTDKQIELYNPEFDKVFYLKLDDDDAKKRLLSRGREDDTEEVVKRRISTHTEVLKPIIEHYQQKLKDNFHEIDAGQNIDQVYKEIKDKVA